MATRNDMPTDTRFHAGEPWHYALFYESDEEYVDGLRAYFEPAVESGEPMLASVPRRRHDLLRNSFNGDRSALQLLEMEEVGRNPGRIIAAIKAALDSYGGRRLHFVGEPIWAGRTSEEIREATKHEALINLAFADAPIRVLCPYDVKGLDGAVLADAEHTHPHMLDADREWPSAAW